MDRWWWAEGSVTMCALLVECHWLYIALDSLHSQTQVDMKLPRAISTYKSTHCNIRNDSWHTPRSSDLHVLDLNVPTKPYYHWSFPANPTSFEVPPALFQPKSVPGRVDVRIWCLRHEPERRTGLGIQATKAESRKPKAEVVQTKQEAGSRKPKDENRKPQAEGQKPKAENRKPNTEAMCEVCTKSSHIA